MINVHSFVFNEFQENTFILWDDTRSCIIVDPGCSDKREEKMLDDFILGKNLAPVKIVNTHCHIDHILGNNYVAGKYNIDTYAHKDDIPLMNSSGNLATVFGLTLDRIPEIDHFLQENSGLTFGEASLQVLHVPGHSPGSIALYTGKEAFVIAGDVLFRGSIGRTDLPGGNYDTLISSIRQKLMTLPANVTVYPGHGPSTTIQLEHDTNPFLQ